MMDDRELLAGKRQADRDSLFLGATLRVDGLRDPVFARVRNLSPGGMMVDGNAGFQVGARVATELRGIGQVDGRITWATPGRAGIAFDTEVDPRLARAPVAVKEKSPVYGKQQQYSRRPGLRSGR